jgi:hypothetical protein
MWRRYDVGSRSGACRIEQRFLLSYPFLLRHSTWWTTGHQCNVRLGSIFPLNLDVDGFRNNTKGEAVARALPAIATSTVAVVVVASIFCTAKHFWHHPLKDRVHGRHARNDYEQVGLGYTPVHTRDIVICDFSVSLY